MLPQPDVTKPFRVISVFFFFSSTLNAQKGGTGRGGGGGGGGLIHQKTYDAVKIQHTWHAHLRGALNGMVSDVKANDEDCMAPTVV